MEEKLSKLFEFQRFEKNKQLDMIIRGVQDRLESSEYCLNESALSLVAGGKKSEEDFKQKEREKN